MWLYIPALLVLYLLFRWYQDRQTLPNLTDNYVLITGCDSGFGNQLARQLDRRGLRVLATCLTQKGAEQLKQVASQRLQTVILDVANTKSVAAMGEWVKRQVGDKGLWGLVNNAGIGFPMGPNEWLTRDDFLKVINVNLLGVIDVTLSLLPLVRKARGRIVNVASVMGRLAAVGGGYCIAKFGVEAFSDSLRRELSSLGVKVAVVEPGGFKTSIASLDQMKEQLQGMWDRVPREVKESYGQQCYDKSKYYNVPSPSRLSGGNGECTATTAVRGGRPFQSHMLGITPSTAETTYEEASIPWLNDCISTCLILAWA